MSSGEGGSVFYGVILMISGAILLVIGIMNLVGFNPLIGLSGSDPTVARAVGTSAWTDIVIAGWGFISGYGLIKDQEWAWGTSLLILTYVVVKFLNDSIQGIWALIVSPATAIYSISVWVYVILFCIGVFGIIYLLATKYKYA
ncbi:MAG: hypothetical protein EAX96_14955 [Candidatus Lokiarchaeota archaeon]|nr:hypothetical protein [Candidatus Lokiarchaeota archaeon]